MQNHALVGDTDADRYWRCDRGRRSSLTRWLGRRCWECALLFFSPEPIAKLLGPGGTAGLAV